MGMLIRGFLRDEHEKVFNLLKAYKKDEKEKNFLIFKEVVYSFSVGKYEDKGYVIITAGTTMMGVNTVPKEAVGAIDFIYYYKDNMLKRVGGAGYSLIKEFLGNYEVCESQ